MKEKLIIVGISQTAEQLFSFVQKYELFDVLGFAVDKKYINDTTFMGLDVYALEDLDTIFDKNSIKLFVALSWNKLNADRRDLYNRLKSLGYSFANVISPNSYVYGTIEGDNCWVHDLVSIYYDARVGSNNIFLTSALVGSSSTIGSHCFCGVKSTVCGECSVGNQTFIGTNATVFDGRKVGNKCLIGGCVAVNRDLPDNSLIKFGAGAQQIKQYSEQEIEAKLVPIKNVKL